MKNLEWFPALINQRNEGHSLTRPDRRRRRWWWWSRKKTMEGSRKKQLRISRIGARCWLKSSISVWFVRDNFFTCSEQTREMVWGDLANKIYVVYTNQGAYFTYTPGQWEMSYVHCCIICSALVCHCSRRIIFLKKIRKNPDSTLIYRRGLFNNILGTLKWPILGLLKRRFFLHK